MLNGLERAALVVGVASLSIFAGPDGVAAQAECDWDCELCRDDCDFAWEACMLFSNDEEDEECWAEYNACLMSCIGAPPPGGGD